MTKTALNHEDTACGYFVNDEPNDTTCSYTVVVQVWDGLDEDRNEQDTSTINDDIIDDKITVKITVSDVDEKPAAPAVTVTSPVDGTDLVVTWDAPDNTGPAITGYRLECTGHEVPDDQCPQDIEASGVTNGTGTHSDNGADRRQGIPGAVAGEERRGRRRVVELGHAVDQQRNQRPARIHHYPT